jgi:hypothetical protein
MPTSPNTLWKATPNKTDHLTSGFTSKVIYNFQFTTGVEVPDNDDVFGHIQGFGKNTKGNFHLPDSYFAGDNGQGFRITMYFLKLVDGNSMSLNQSLWDRLENSEIVIASPIYTTAINEDIGGGDTLAKYECYLTKFTVPAGATYIQATGNIIYSSKGNGTVVAMTPFNNYVAIDPNGEYDLYIKNGCADRIKVVSLMVEEIS